MTLSDGSRAHLEADRPISTQPKWVLILFIALGFIPWLLKCFAEVFEECADELDRRNVG
jgi:hypothetical protein